MLFYSGILLALFLLTIIEKKRSADCVIAAFVCVFLAMLMAFKSTSVGNDTQNYVYFFERLNSLSDWVDSTSRFEVGYQLYCKFISSYIGDYQYMFATTGLICMFCIGRGAMKISPQPTFSMLLFVGLRLYYFFLSGLRQSIAISLVVLAFLALSKRKNIQFILLTLLASTFHTSAIIFFIALPLSRLKFTKKRALTIVLVTAVAYVAFVPILNAVLSLLPEYYSHYTETVAFSANNLGNYVDLAIKLLFIVMAVKMGYTRGNADDKESMDDTFMYFMIVAACLAFLATRASILDRMESYFWIFSIYSIPRIIQYKTGKMDIRLIGFVSIFCIVYNLGLLYFRPEWNAIIPYSFFWEK